MKNYLAFAGSRYYPLGGMRDFIEDFDTLEQALTMLKTHKVDCHSFWHSVYSIKDRKEVYYRNEFSDDDDDDE